MRAELRRALAGAGAVVDESRGDGRASMSRGSWRAAAAAAHEAGARFFDLTAIDRDEAVELVLMLVDGDADQFSLRTACPNDDLTADSVSTVFPPAEWAEREVYDLFGVEFAGNPDMTRILQPDSATIFPLRRSFLLEERAW
jgi:NADH-quinone oxidoreductase subunit C